MNQYKQSQPSVPRDWREGRRLRAWELHQLGWKQHEIAAALGVTPGAVSQWLKRAREAGAQALRRRPAPGRRPRLTPQQREQLPHLLSRGATAWGFRGEFWTTARIVGVIEQQFGVRYHRASISRLLQAIGWSRQKPVRRAKQRDEAALAQWRDERWPAIQRGR
jgi:transposase